MNQRPASFGPCDRNLGENDPSEKAVGQWDEPRCSFGSVDFNGAGCGDGCSPGVAPGLLVGGETLPQTRLLPSVSWGVPAIHLSFLAHSLAGELACHCQLPGWPPSSVVFGVFLGRTSLLCRSVRSWLLWWKSSCSMLRLFFLKSRAHCGG